MEFKQHTIGNSTNDINGITTAIKDNMSQEDKRKERGINNIFNVLHTYYKKKSNIVNNITKYPNALELYNNEIKKYNELKKENENYIKVYTSNSDDKILEEKKDEIHILILEDGNILTSISVLSLLFYIIENDYVDKTWDIMNINEI
jgi:hypothetical protein